MWLIKASLRNPYMVATLVFIMMFLGIISAFNIPVDILPVFNTPAVEVLTYYQGMPASSVEKTITNRIERWVNQAPGAAIVESRSVPGVSVAKIYFRDDIKPAEALTTTNSLALGTLPTLPPNTLPPVVLPFDPTGTLPLGVLTVSNPHLDEAKIKDLARIDVRNMLGAVKGAVAPVVVGGKDRTVLVYLDPQRLQNKNLSPLDVVHALQDQNLMVTPGTAYFGPYQVLLDSDAMVKHVEDLNALPVRIEPNNFVYLRDVGHAEDAYAIQTSRVRIDGRPQVYVPVYRQGGASSLDVAEGVKERIDYIQSRLPEDTKVNFVMDQSVYVKEAIVSLVHEGIIGAVMVSIMILIFLGNIRMTLIASLSIPLAILGAITGLYTTGQTINAMTLGGLALAIGPLVDDAIVELENNHRNYHLGKSRYRAALDGCAEVMVPVMVATGTTIIVLAPLAFMPGMGGFLFRPLALAVAFAMLASFLLSRTFVPMMCAKFLPDEHRNKRGHGPTVTHGTDDHERSWFGRVHQRIDRFLIRQTKRYERFLAFALRHRVAVLGTVLALFLGSLTLMFGIGREFFPQVDAGQITIYLRAPSNLRLDASEKRVAEVEKFLEKEIPADEREMIVSELGLDPDWSAAYTANAGQQDTVIRVQLSENRKRTAQEYAIQLRHAFADNKKFNDLRVSFDTGGMVSTALNYGVSSPIDIQISGGSTAEAFDLARKVRQRVAGVKGAADVRIGQRLDAPYLVMEINRQKAANIGLTTRQVVEQVVAAMNSSISINRNFWIDEQSGNQYFVGVQYPEDPNATLETLENIYATGTKQTQPVTLKSLVEFRPSTDAVEVNHVSLYRTFNVLVNTEDRAIGSVAKDVEERIKPLRTELDERIHRLERERSELRSTRGADARLRLEKVDKELKDIRNLTWELRGEYKRMNDSFRQLGIGMALAAVLVYLLQVALFRSWTGPFIIMFTVPLGLIGVLTMLFVTHTTLNVQSQMGVIFLVGIAVNNGVLLVEFANKQRRLGAPVYEAITTAAAIRFRPILMTFLATFLDLTPMAIGFGKGSEATVPLARAVVGGLLTSTFLTLVVVPILYTLLMKEGEVSDADIEAELADRPETLIAREEAAGVADEVAAAAGAHAPPTDLPPEGGGGFRAAPRDGS
jgi:multidrug efflux pump subunit AcrB